MKVLVTGATNGIGRGVAQALAARDDQVHEIVILGRSKELGESTVREFQRVTHNPKVSFVHCDLTHLSDVKEAISVLHQQHDHLDGVFINAGLGYAAKRVETADGMDPHFQVNYLSQFMLTLNLLDLLEGSENGGRVVFNVTAGGYIIWDDIQMKKKWSYEDGIHQAMVAKRMFYSRLHELHGRSGRTRVSFYGFEVPKTVWTNQVNIIPSYMRVMATLWKWRGGFITIEECGEIVAPLFTEDREASLQRSGRFFTAIQEDFVEKDEDRAVLDQVMQDRLWSTSLDLCNDENTRRIADELRQARGA